MIELRGVIFLNIKTKSWEESSDYLYDTDNSLLKTSFEVQEKVPSSSRGSKVSTSHCIPLVVGPLMCNVGPGLGFLTVELWQLFKNAKLYAQNLDSYHPPI